MTHSKFEKYASSKITQHQSSVDTDALWKAVAPEAPKKKRRIVFWYFLSGLLVTGLVSAILWNSTNTPDIQPNNLADIRQEAEMQRTDALSKNATSSKHSVSTENSTPVQNNTNLKDEINMANDQQKNAILKDEKDIAKAQQKKAISKEEKDIVHVQQKTGISIETGISANQGQHVDSNSIIFGNSPNEIVFSNSSELYPQEENIGNTFQNGNIQLSDDLNHSTLSIQSIGLVDVSIKEHEANRTHTLPTSLLTIEPNIPDSILSSNKPNPSSKHKLTYSIGAYGGISGTSSTLTARDSSSYEYLNARNQSEKQLETYQFGIEFGAEIFKGLMIKSGIEVSRLARVFTINVQKVDVDSVYGLKEIFVNNQTQDTINVYGQVPVITTTEYNKKTYNNISQIDIPVKVGYAFRSEKWRFGLDVGTIINLNTSYTGEILAQDGTFYDLKSDPENWFKTNAGLSFTAGLSIGHTLGSSFEIYLAPVYRSASIFSTDVNPIEQAHARFGANLGIRYLLGQ